MKTILTVLVVLCVACNSKEVAMKETNTGPRLQLAGDTLYVREKDPNNLNGNGIFPMQALPAAHQLHLRLNDTSGYVHFSYRGQLLQNDQPVLVAGEWNSLFCSVDTSGVFGVELSLKDQLGRIATKTLVIKAAAAQRPRASLSWKADSRDETGRRYYFDASGCSQPYGKILSYHYTIGQQNFVSSVEQVTYLFHTKGVYPVSFFVVDDLGQHSDTLHYNIDVP